MFLGIDSLFRSELYLSNVVGSVQISNALWQYAMRLENRQGKVLREIKPTYKFFELEGTLVLCTTSEYQVNRS